MHDCLVVDHGMAVTHHRDTVPTRALLSLCLTIQALEVPVVGFHKIPSRYSSTHMNLEAANT